MNSAEAAKYLGSGLTAKDIAKLARAGIISGQKHKGKWQFTRTSVEAFRRKGKAR